jgi:Tfp pilus assembly major pilin PilA
MGDPTGGATARPDADSKFCTDCGAIISRRAEICPKCGVRQIAAKGKSTSNTLVKGCLIVVFVFFVIFVIGIIAAIAIPKFASTKEKAYVAAMKSDLRNFAVYEEQYAADNGGRYFSGDGAAQGFTPSSDVSVTGVATRSPDSWTATVRSSLTSRTCGIRDGLISCPPAP